MKTRYIITVLFFLISGFSIAQNVPHGMNYQAVARNKSGEILADKTIFLKVKLLGNKSNAEINYYTEIQRTVTDHTGLFIVAVGKGSTLTGNFDGIPWSTENIWMQVDIREESETEFTPVSFARLLAVPYAFHAATANSASTEYVPYVLSGSSSGNTINAVPANSWKVTGNSLTNPAIEYLGTADLKDLVWRTNGIERMRIYSTGNINITNNVNIGVDLNVGHDLIINRDLKVKNDVVIDSNLTVKKNVFFNTMLGATINYGPFTVGNVSPTILNGTLRVDKSTNLNNNFNVNNIKPTLLTGTLKVNNATDLYSSLTVFGQSPTVFTGTLRVDSNVLFKSHLTLTNGNYNSFSTTTGAMVVSGGTGIAKNLNVGGGAKVAGNTTLKGQVKVTDGRPSFIPDSGAIVVAGGVGIGKELSIGGFAHFFDSSRVDGIAMLRKTLFVFDSLTLRNKIKVTGATTLLGQLNNMGQVTINVPSLTAGIQSNFSDYPLQVRGGKQGIAIRVTGSKANANNFMSFWDANGMQGRIEGYATGEYSNTAEFTKFDKNYIVSISAFTTISTLQIVKGVAAGVSLVGALTSSTGCVGLGVCVTTPIPSMIAAGIFSVANSAVAASLAAVKLAETVDAYTTFNGYVSNKNGVTYESGAGDYAEYLPLMNPGEKMFPGDVVGLKNGKVSRNTMDADKIMVLSIRPIVLGNSPKAGEENNFIKVAFLGQVAVKVSGRVTAGDYILPDGNNSGMGIAISPENISSSDIKKILGIAWSSSESNGINSINVAVGLNVNDNISVIQGLENDVDKLRNTISLREERLQKAIPGYKTLTASNGISVNAGPARNTDSYTYFQVSKSEVEQGVDLFLERLNSMDEKIQQIPVFKKMKNNSSFREELIREIQDEINSQLLKSKQINSGSVR